MVGTATAGGRGKVLAIVALSVLLVLGGAAYVALAPPAALITPRVAGQIKAATGLDLKVGGAARYKLVPRFTMHLENVTLTSPAGGEPVVKAAALDAVMPLSVALGGDGDILAVSAAKPAFRLVRDAAGKANWQSDAHAGSAASAAAPLALRNIHFKDGTIEYRDLKSGDELKLEGVSAQTAVDAASGALTGEASATYRGEPVTMQISAANGRRLLAGGPTEVKVKLASREVKAAFDGEARVAAREADGNLSLSAPGSKDIAKLLATSTDLFLGEGAVSLSGRIAVRNGGVTLTAADVGLGRSSARADIALTFTGVRPAAKGSVAWNELDLTAFAPASKPPPGSAPAAAAVAGEGPAVASAFDGLAKALAAIEKGGSAEISSDATAPAAAAQLAAAQWSDAPFDLSGLAAVDGDVAMRAAKLRVGGLTLENGEADVKLEAGKLAVDVKRLDLGKGRTKGRIGIEADHGDPSARIDLSMDDVPSEMLLAEIMGRPVLSGPADVNAKLAAKGRSVRQIVSSLEGQVRFGVGKGTLEGFDIARMLAGAWKSWSYDKRYHSSFQRIDGQYSVRKGIAVNDKDAAFDSAVVEVTANGKVSAPARTLDQRLKLKVVQEGLLHGLTFPLRFYGRWDNLQGDWDWGGWFAAPQTLANPLLAGGDKAAVAAAMPKGLREQIERVLAMPGSETKLAEPVRAALRSLIEPAASAAPNGAGPAGAMP